LIAALVGEVLILLQMASNKKSAVEISGRIFYFFAGNLMV